MTSTEIAVRENGHVAERDVVDGWVLIASAVIKVANHIAETDFVPKEYRGNPPAVAAAILTGRELGIGPMMSLRHVQIVRGVPTLSAEYKRARVLAAGHDFEVEELNTTRCRLRGRRKGTSKWLETKFTMDDARQAKIIKPDGAWTTRPRRMLFARAGSELCDFLFADVTNGLPTTELVADGTEADEFAGYDESPQQAEPAAANGHAPEPRPRTAQRRARPETPAAPREASRRAEGAAGTEAGSESPAAPAGGLPPLPGEEEVPTSGAAATEATGPASGASSSPSSGDDPATPGWVGLIVKHFERLGITDRDVRLGYTGMITGREVGSTKDLSGDEAKVVLDMLARCKNRERLMAVLDEHQAAHPGGEARADAT